LQAPQSVSENQKNREDHVLRRRQAKCRYFVVTAKHQLPMASCQLRQTLIQGCPVRNKTSASLNEMYGSFHVYCNAFCGRGLVCGVTEVTTLIF
jgi:hypothetical protein